MEPTLQDLAPTITWLNAGPSCMLAVQVRSCGRQGTWNAPAGIAGSQLVLVLCLRLRLLLVVMLLRLHVRRQCCVRLNVPRLSRGAHLFVSRGFCAFYPQYCGAGPIRLR